MFKQAKNHVNISVGHMVYSEQYQRLDIKPDAIAKLFKKNVYRLPKRNKRQLGFVADCEAVAHPENKQRIKHELEHCELLGHTSDDKEIYLYKYFTNSVLMREIGRLRELTFRAVKEGTGRCRDVDNYDHYYDHLILWDDKVLELVGAYRLGRSNKILLEHGSDNSLYTQTLFNYKESFKPYFSQGLELGRSFVQPKYWGRRSLDYLWQGIGVYLKKYPDIRYLFGPVSISHDYPDQAKDLLIGFYQHYFGSDKLLASAKTPYLNDRPNIFRRYTLFKGDDYKGDFVLLKQAMTEMGLTIPTMYKQYTELCEHQGVEFIDFHVDVDFADCVDGLILVDLEKIKRSKRQRYMGY
jgi:hypothetical protein